MSDEQKSCVAISVTGLFKRGAHIFARPLLLLWLSAAVVVPNLRADNVSRCATEGQAAVESWLRKDTNEWFKAQFGDFVRMEGSGFGTPVWNIQGYDYLTLNRTAHFTRGKIPVNIYVVVGEPGQTNVGTPVLEGQVSSVQGARIFVSHPEFHLGLTKRQFTRAEIEAYQRRKKAEEQRPVAGVNQKQFEQAKKRWGDEGLMAVASYLRNGTNEINAICGEFVCFQNDGYPQYSFDAGSDSNPGRKSSMRVMVRTLFLSGYIPLTIIITEGRATAPALINVGTPVIEEAISLHTGARILVSHPELCSQAEYLARDSLKFLTAEGEAKLVGEYKLGVSVAERSAGPKSQTCTLQLRADHTLVISNYPAPGDAQRHITIPGNWSLSAYRNRNIGDSVLFRMSVSGGDEVKLQGATCNLIYPNNFGSHVSFLPGLDVICRGESGNQQKLSFRAAKGILPSGMRPNPHFVTRSPTGNPPNWDTPVCDNPESRLREGIITQRKQNTTNNSYLATLQVRLADLLRERGKLNEAQSNVLEGFQVMRKVFGNQHVEVADALVVQARILREKGELEEAEKVIREAHAIHSNKFTPNNYKFQQSLRVLNQVLELEGKPKE